MNETPTGVPRDIPWLVAALAAVHKSGLPLLQGALLVLKLLGRLDLPWWAVVIPGVFYVLFPLLVGVGQPIAQRLRYALSRRR